MGFSFFEQNTRRTFSFEFKIMIGDAQHCQKEMRLGKAEYPDPANPQLIFIDLEKLGIQCPEVRQQENIHILVKSWEDNYSDGYYGYGSTAHNENPMNANNEDDFEVEIS